MMNDHTVNIHSISDPMSILQSGTGRHARKACEVRTGVCSTNPTWSGSQMEAHSLWDLVLENPTWSGSRTRAPYVPERDRVACAQSLRGADRGLFYEPDLVGFTHTSSIRHVHYPLATTLPSSSSKI